MTGDPTDFARELRQRQTRAEEALWKALRGRRLDGLKFRRQHPIGRYFADFACEPLRLLVELDGGVHDQDDTHLNDHLRQQEMEAFGWCLLRFPNERVLSDIAGVLEEISHQARLAGDITPHPPTQLR